MVQLCKLEIFYQGYERFDIMWIPIKKQKLLVHQTNTLINDNSAIQLDSVTSVLKHLRLNHPQ